MTINPLEIEVLKRTAFPQRTLSKRVFDWLFGHDFFISYRQSDGLNYACDLARRLKAERFDCFLDSEGFVKGDNWRRIGNRELRKTSRLVLVGSPEVPQSEPVAHELKVFSRTGRRVFAIAFVDSLSPKRLPQSLILPHLDHEALRHSETADRLATGPSDIVIRELRRTFTVETTTVRRLRVIQAAAAVLVLLALLASAAAMVAHRQYRFNLASAARADAQRGGAEADAGNFDSAVGYFARSLRKNPDDPLVVGALLRLAACRT